MVYDVSSWPSSSKQNNTTWSYKSDPTSKNAIVYTNTRMTIYLSYRYDVLYLLQLLHFFEKNATFGSSIFVDLWA